MRVIFSLMDADGDGKLSLQEWQSAHERIFKAMDTNHDGAVTFEEMQAFMHGADKRVNNAPRKAATESSWGCRISGTLTSDIVGRAAMRVMQK
jgi:Ca2+-binding EF-hand superfamily protein